MPPYNGCLSLAGLYPRGYVRPNAYASDPKLQRGQHVYIGDRVSIHLNYKDSGGVVLGDRSVLFGNNMLHAGLGAAIRIGQHTHIQPDTRLHAFLADIEIGSHVEIAASCAVYSYNHGMDPGTLIMDQDLTAKGPVSIGDGAWLGHGVTVLSGVRIGAGAVIAAGAVVTQDIPDNAIAGGIPAKVIGSRLTEDSPAPTPT